MTPTPRLLQAILALTLLAGLIPFSSLLESTWNLLAGALLLVTAIDFATLRRPPRIRVKRHIHHSIPVDVWTSIELDLHHAGGHPLDLLVHDHHPGNFDSEDLPRTIRLPPARRARISYRIRPLCRGDAVFSGTDLRLLSPFGLWHRKIFLPLEDRVRVFPNFREVSRYTLLASDNRLSQLGVRRRQRRGEGNDFHQLREYRAGDSLRQIDWKATSRYQKLISREYQDERDQQIVFVLDCGRRMRHQEGGSAHLDQALNSMLLLTHVAAQQDDAVGLFTFGGQERWYPPRKSGHRVRNLLEQTYDLESTTEPADYLVATRRLLTLQQRRALVILLTNTRDEDQDELQQAVRLLTRRHLVVLADLRESLLDETRDRPIQDLDSALTFHAIRDYLETRRKQHELLRHHGAITLDLLAPQLPGMLVNRYLEIKAQGQL